MNSYVVSYLLAANYSPAVRNIDRRWMEVLCITPAESETLAREMTEQLAKEYESSYQAADGTAVDWKLVGCAGIWLTEEVTASNPVELFSRFLTASEGESLLKPFED